LLRRFSSATVQLLLLLVLVLLLKDMISFYEGYAAMLRNHSSWRHCWDSTLAYSMGGCALVAPCEKMCKASLTFV
jgi:hypothetical protein